jgi:hypothetical protein
MPNDREIAVLCDIGQFAQFDADKARVVQDLVARGYLERDGALFKLTDRGEQLLTDRGAGLNES